MVSVQQGIYRRDAEARRMDDCGYRLDLIIEDTVIIELKTVECILPIHEAQLLTYLKMKNLRLGLLINFNVPVLKACSEQSESNGIKRIVNNL